MDSSMCTYLHKRGSTYYFRRVIPDDVKPLFGDKPEWIFSLRTKDRAEGARRARLEGVRYDQIVEGARARLASEKGENDGITPSIEPTADDALDEIEREQAEFQMQEQEAAKERRRRRRVKRDEFRRRMEFSTAELSSTEQVARDVIREKEARIRALEAQLAAPVTVSAALPANSAPEGVSAARLMDLFDGYVAERRPKLSTITSWRPVINHLIKFLRHDDATRISAGDLNRWKAKLLEEPLPSGKPRAASTIKDCYFAALKTVFAWGVENERLIDNAAAKLTLRAPKRQRLRDPGFNRDEAETILKASLEPPSSNISPEQKLARRWVPWLCAYTGARVNEIGQLRGQDVRCIEDIWTIRITPEAGPQKTDAARIVPLHPHLIEQGFLQAISGKGNGALFYDPSRQRTPGSESRHPKKVGERLAQWVRSLGITDENVKPNHAWRHRFKTEGRRVGMDAGVLDVLQGHAHRTEGEKYGSYPLSRLSAEIEKLPRFIIEGT